MIDNMVRQLCVDTYNLWPLEIVEIVVLVGGIVGVAIGWVMGTRAAR